MNEDDFLKYKREYKPLLGIKQQASKHVIKVRC